MSNFHRGDIVVIFKKGDVVDIGHLGTIVLITSDPCGCAIDAFHMRYWDHHHHVLIRGQHTWMTTYAELLRDAKHV